MASATWKALVVQEVGMALEVVQHEGDSCCFESSSTVVDAFLEEGTVASELGDFGVNESTLLFPSAVVDDIGVGLPVGQLMGCFGQGVESGRSASKELEEPCPHGVGGDA